MITRRGQLALVATVAASGALGLALSLWQGRDLTPNDEERAQWQRAIAAVVEQHAPDDLLVLYPPHRHALLALIPPTIAAGTAVPIEAPERRNHVTLWVASDEGFPPELDPVSFEERGTFDTVRVRRYRYPDTERVRYDFVENVAAATVWMELQSSRVPCDQRRGGRVYCRGRPEWNNVGPVDHTVDGQPLHCLWAHPSTDATTVVEYPRVPLGDQLVVVTALTDDAATTPGGAAVQLTAAVFADGASDALVTRTVTHANRRGTTTVQLPLTRGGEGRVRFAITTRNDARRHFCFSAAIKEKMR